MSSLVKQFGLARVSHSTPGNPLVLRSSWPSGKNCLFSRYTTLSSEGTCFPIEETIKCNNVHVACRAKFYVNIN